ncbi:MAG: DUF5060 domain-containing protein [Bacteroidota bacterium]
MTPALRDFLVIVIFFLKASLVVAQNENNQQISSTKIAHHRGVYEVIFNALPTKQNPYYDISLKVTFTRPDGSLATVDGFYDGGTRYRARAYCDQTGKWQWQSKSNNSGLDNQQGTFEVLPSDFRGKLRIHSDDPYQFAYDNGEWFLHIGDTGYRYVVPTEPHWKDYIDQAAEMGATKIRTWFAMSRGEVNELLMPNRHDLSLFVWKEIEHRLQYALEKYPQIIFQLMPHAEDTEMIRRYGEGDEVSRLIARYAQARWSSFPNIQWAMTNDRKIKADTVAAISGREVYHRTIRQMGQDYHDREPWGTLITNHQARFTGYDFAQEPWSDIVTLESLDEVDGKLILEYREKIKQPAVLDEDRYELYRPPAHPRYFFRRLMWASLFSGGHATYGGLKTYDPYLGSEFQGPDKEVILSYQAQEGRDKGVTGYFDANRAGILFQGGHDFRHIHQFFRESGLTLVSMQPDDSLVGGDALQYKCIHNDDEYLVYLANPSGGTPKSDYPKEKIPTVTLRLPKYGFSVRWFDPDTGTWAYGSNVLGTEVTTLTSPAAGDWVLWLSRR